jgi:ectoine hydroxylase-related dioxygenase (phytanoyl-CoA dioxygenase family)
MISMNPMAPADPLRPLSKAEVDAFVEDGAVCVRGVMSQEWLEVATDAIARNLAEPTFIGQLISLPDEGYLNDVFVWLQDDGFRRFVLESPAATIAGQALAGLGATTMSFFYDQTFVKEPGTQVPTPWHHDLTFWPVEGSQMCSIWMPLDPVTTSTSGLEYVLGSHRWPNRFKAITPDYNEFMLNPELEDMPDIDGDRDRYRVTAWDMEPGDVLVFHPLVVHGSKGNSSTTTRRRALATRWFGDDVVFRDLPFTMPLPPGHGLSDGEHFGGPIFPSFGALATR